MSDESDKGTLDAVTNLVWLSVMPFVRGWLVMITLGVLHSNGVAVPALGYWTSLLLSVTVSSVVGSTVWRTWQNSEYNRRKLERARRSR